MYFSKYTINMQLQIQQALGNFVNGTYLLNQTDYAFFLYQQTVLQGV